MANCLTQQQRDELRTKVLRAAARLFVEKGYTATTTRELAVCAGVQVSAMNRAFGSKEHILSELVHDVMNSQFSEPARLRRGKVGDKVFSYALDVALQFHMAENSESVRDLFSSAYTLPEVSERLLRSMTEKVIQPTFSVYLPGNTMEDFYELEIATGNILRGYMAVRCSEAFPMKKKISRFLEAALRIYRVPEVKIRQAELYISQFDLEEMAARLIRELAGAGE